MVAVNFQPVPITTDCIKRCSTPLVVRGPEWEDRMDKGLAAGDTRRDQAARLGGARGGKSWLRALVVVGVITVLYAFTALTIWGWGKALGP